jgi:hypothetical protein
MDQEYRPISLLSFLEAENIRLRRAVVELWLDTAALREALKGQDSSELRATVRPRDVRPTPCVTLVHDENRPPSK